MRYFETVPAPEHRRHIESLWRFHADNIQGDAPAHVIVPDGAVSLSYVLTPDGQVFAGLTGPSVNAHRMTLMPGARYAGIRLRPGAAGAVLGADIMTYRDILGPIIVERPAILDFMQNQVRCGLESAEIDGVLNHVVSKIVAESALLDQAVCDFASRIMRTGGDVVIKDLTLEMGLGERQLRRRFKYQCGLTPKEFSRLRRIRQACIDLLSRADQAQANTAARSGFSDQSHMTREFKDVFGNSTTLIEDYLKQIAHGHIIQEVE